ncbi:bifunctional 2-C-methyl-D-erythritol 4-phosphate cytidylyltransferase/2-C-methyl-D-erythritol 2,4-cyclodiphosphate synthase [Alisedimentitalea sp. MJ-SS2]|uniref:bifunctional 2-C-methyl-D-erythritol 4-phosphate cytidylyltransferase/2-C-methyl-D-erythritol 2,4-cyclodiphosphate synthase n=1 Tax=Aliisedimentitalea sp. MJ-SS2 TaxID=3049795 RepID=UPI002911A558|nr:bifunctional 2-C-methyl-D-erythritol 4-phosphate cytidylyltransferase/2-C-methyl-D-erythritol 2,4-cyclodiphosphate synthase [Alisedimentitalea sp. MJ-SS2]MDU8929689.1 bifunctional 2-C-methyl-D-erythritol 4-phosphate cytidylyltransferase/2-C-methyl-D-erythritol 2,4-cyclodiphosphate synthase [Alisedimentitalea sp. MJ-SS2]
MTTTAAIIVAAGRGTRAGPGAPKQWRPLAGRRVIDWTLDAFLAVPGIGPIMVVLHTDDIADFTPPQGVQTCIGGATRAASVRAGLEALVDIAPDNVLIHDVARPCVTQHIIADVIAALAIGPGAAPAVPVTDALWRGSNDKVSGTQDRDGLYRAQTPQGFHFAEILAAHQSAPGDAADDVEIARAAGLEVAIVSGHENNLKITHSPDFQRAETILRGTMDIRLGNGFDVHAFTEGDHLILCGVEIPHTQALKGHSDADVGMHAVTDAIYGAVAQGDIGRHFPPSDPQWKGAASHIFLRHAVELAREMGFTFGNIDCTLICERPKVGPHAGAMTAAMAEILQIDPTRVSIKATTSERLGFTGREEGIAALATATLIKE